MPIGIQCDSGVPAKYLGRATLESFNQVAGDICFYSCFFTSLLDASILRHDGLRANLQSAGRSFLALARYVLEQGVDMSEAGGSIFRAIVDGLTSLLEGGYQDVKGALGGHGDFASTLWVFIKAEISRYFQPLLLAAIRPTKRLPITNKKRLVHLLVSTRTLVSFPNKSISSTTFK